MSDFPPAALSEADAQLLHHVREQLLGKTPASTPFLPPVVPTPPRLAFWLRILAVGFGLLAAALSILEWLDPERFAGCKQAATLVLLGIGVGWFIQRTRQFKAAQKLAVLPDPPPPLSFWPRLLLSLYWFVVVEVVVLTPIDMAWIVGVLALHETGHYLGMRWFGYRDMRMFFVPALGAAVSGHKPGVPAWQEAIVLLLGPLPGLLLGCGIYFVDLVEAVPLLRTGAAWLVMLNFLNLLPFEPLDGGKLCNRHLFSRVRWLEAVAVVLGAIGLVLVCLGPVWICLALTAALALFALAPARYKLSRAAAQLQTRWPQLPSEWVDLSEDQWHDLFLAASSLVKQKQAFTQLSPAAAKTMVNAFALQMRALQARALSRPESVPVTALILAVYLSTIVLGIVTASVTRLQVDAGRWPLGTEPRPQTATAPP